MMTAPEETAQELYDEAPCGYVSIGPDGAFRRANRTFAELTGYDVDELLGRCLRDLLTPGGRIYYETHVAPLLAMQGGVSEIAAELVCRDGTRLPVLLNAVVRNDLVRMTVSDARQRREYERELVRATRRTERLLQLTAALAEPLSPEEIADAVLDLLLEQTGAEGGAVSCEGRVLALRGEVGGGATQFALVEEGATVGAVALDLDGRPLHRRETDLAHAAATLCTQALARQRQRDERERALGTAEEQLARLENGFWHLRKVQEVLPMCMGCRRVRDEAGSWEELHAFLLRNSRFVSHGLCDSCTHVIAA
jgi:PAS domain S-box-containing protein